MSVDYLMSRPRPLMKRKKSFSSGRITSRDLPLSRTSRTDKCKISIMISYNNIYVMLQDSTCLRNNMNNYSSTNILIQNIVCSEDFFLNDDAFCRPKCQSWLMFSRTAETASLAIIGSATVIGILTTVVIIILSFVHYRKM